MSDLVLSIFPSIDLLGRAFEEEGFCVVRGPDLLWGGDIRSFHPPAARFDGVIGGPPCQAFSSLANLVRARGYEPRYGNLIPEFERVVRESDPDWFLMENVPAAPVPAVEDFDVHSFVIDNACLDSGDGFGEEQMRKRRFSFGVRGFEAPDLRRWMRLAALELPRTSGTVTQTNVDNSPKAKGRRPTVTCRKGVPSKSPAVISHQGAAGRRLKRYTLADACRLQGLPEDFLEDAPFTAQGKLSAVANGVPLSMGRQLAQAVRAAMCRSTAEKC